jgi:hypothetical protein
MTVWELIKELEKYNDDAVVIIYKDVDYSSDVKDVRQPKKDETHNENIVVITNY